MKKTRSQVMASIRSRDTSPERLLRSALWSSGFRYKLHYPTPVGRPDLVFLGRRTAIFVDGCQWHGCPEHYVKPRSRQDFWEKKLQTNFLRDARQTIALKELGWRVIRLWEHEIFEELERTIQRISLTLDGLDTEDEHSWRVWKVDVIDPGEDLECRYLRTLNSIPLEQSVVRRRSTRKWRNRISQVSERLRHEE